MKNKSSWHVLYHTPTNRKVVFCPKQGTCVGIFTDTPSMSKQRKNLSLEEMRTLYRALRAEGWTPPLA